MKRLLATLLLVSPAPFATAAVRLPALFSKHLVLQAGRPAPVWGWADPGEAVTVAFAGQSHTTTADAGGKWRVNLRPLAVSDTPGVLKVSSPANTLQVEDVLVGDVWLCSGQSNMGWRVSQSRDAAREIAAADHPRLRMFFVQSGTALEPQDDCKGVWKVCTPQTAGEFSATAYYFGRELQAARGQPLGLINSSVGGTPVESWTSLAVQQGRPELQSLFEKWAQDLAEHDGPEAATRRAELEAKWKEDVAKAKAAGRPAPRRPEGPGRPRLHNHHPGNLFNGKIAPLIPFALTGAIWYQGESNANPAERAALYDFMFGLMIRDWRERWGQGDFPFAWVQLPNFMAAKPEAVPENENWPILRHSQTRTLALPRTGQTINLDIGEANDIHPANKQDIGKRLALWARAEVYGEKIPWHGPVFTRLTVDGSRARLHFRATEGLRTTDGQPPRAFALAGVDLVWRNAEAVIEGGQIVLSHSDVPAPFAVRYAWANNPPVNLTDATGLPAAPFRTDDAPLFKPTATR
jgi:hypothetical protein